MAGKIPSGISSDAMLNQAQHIWSMLDEMATASPETYQKFIKKQLKDGQEVMKPPNPHMCVQTVIYVRRANNSHYHNNDNNLYHTVITHTHTHIH